MPTRTERLLPSNDRSPRILELGAGFNPIAPKAGGWNTHVVDHAARDELRAKYAGVVPNVDAIEEVDTVWAGGPLDQALPPDLLGQVDILIASHVLEHLPDLIAFLQSASRIVRPGGLLTVALPDRRWCFDVYRPWTTTGELLAAHRRGDVRHSLKTAYDEVAYSATVEGETGWGRRPVTPPLFFHPFSTAAGTAHDYGMDPSAPYQDFHAWQFTPTSFRLLMLELRGLGFIDWVQDDGEASEGIEFLTQLRRPASPSPDPDPVWVQQQRQALMPRMLAEMRDHVDMILGATVAPSAAAPQTADETGPEPGCGGLHQAILRRLDEQDARLAEMAGTLALVRAALEPLRRIRRMLGWRRSR